MKLRFVSLAVLVLLLAHKASAATEVISLPEDELARESVYPKFDTTDTVKNRRVIETKKVELGLYYGTNANEPVYNQTKFGVVLGYHFNEDSAAILNYGQWLGGTNSLYAGSLQQQGQLDLSRIPQLKYSLYGEYDWNIFYGKISFTKQGVMNINLYPIFGAGFTAYSSKNYPGVDIGIGQKYYFTKSWALRLDFKLQYSQYPSPFLGTASGSPTGIGINQPYPSPGDFQDKWRFSNIIDLGISYLL